MNAILKYLIDTFDETPIDEQREAVAKFTDDDCNDFANIVTVVNNTSAVVLSDIWARVGKRR